MAKENLYNVHFGVKRASPNTFSCNIVVGETDLEFLNEFRKFLFTHNIPLTSRSQLIRCAIRTITMDDRTLSIAQTVLTEEKIRTSKAHSVARLAVVAAAKKKKKTAKQ